MMMNDDSLVTVAVTTFNRPNVLIRCLESLRSQTYQNFETVVVNGGDPLHIDEYIKNSALKVRVVQQKKKGLVEARNLCWKEARGEIVCIIDDDLYVFPQWLEEIINTFHQDEKIGGVSGPTLIDQQRAGRRDAISFVTDLDKKSFFFRLIGHFYLNYILEGKVNEVGKILSCGMFSLGSNFDDCLELSQLVEVDYLEACHMCFRRFLIEQVGGFNYCYTGTSEWSEPDLAFKIRKLGYRLVFNPHAITEHRVSQEGVFRARTYAYERSINFICFYFRHIHSRSMKRTLRFYSFLLFINGYWIYKAIETRNKNWLTGLFGTIVGLSKNMFS